MQDYLEVPYSREYLPYRVMDIYLPGSNVNGAALLFIHGGGFVGGSRQQWTEVAKYFRNLGYVTVSIDYRLAPEWLYPAAIEDVRLAMAFLRTKSVTYQFKPDLMGVIGSSAGGYLALMLGILAAKNLLGYSAELNFQDTRPQALVTHAPVSTLQGLDQHRWVVEYLGVREEVDPELYWLASPTNLIKTPLAPTLVIHGDSDQLIPPAHSYNLVAKILEQAGKAEILKLPGVGHGFGYGITSEEQKITNAATVRFLSQHLTE